MDILSFFPIIQNEKNTRKISIRDPKSFLNAQTNSTGKAGGARLEEEVICLLIDIGGLTKIFQYVKLLLKN